MRSEAQIPSFLENNSDLIEKLSDKLSMEQENQNLQLVYHSVPLTCLHDKLYQREFLARFAELSAKHNLVHVIDCTETNEVQLNKKSSYYFTKMVSQISPDIVDIPEL